jgi:effector-binding domain-containing protein
VADFVLREWNLAPYPGDQAPPHIHHRSDEAFIVPEGELEVLVGEERKVRAAGEFAVIPAGTVHTFATHGDAGCRVIAVMTPEIADLIQARHSGEPVAGVWTRHHASLAPSWEPGMPAAHLEHVQPQQLAAIRATAAQSRLGAGIIAALDKIWPVLRAQGVRTGHNVVVYYGGPPDALQIAVGVQVPDGFAADGEVQPVSTPSGAAATVAHFGDYAEMHGAYQALDQWCASNARTRTPVSWEVYGDWEDDPAKRRTDIYFLLES